MTQELFSQVFLAQYFMLTTMYFIHFFILNEDIPYVVMLPNFNVLALWLQPFYDFTNPYILANYTVYGQFYELGCFHNDLEEEDFID